ncbi:MAG: hemerythrin domain-containing protein [Polyangiales bacterium]
MTRDEWRLHPRFPAQVLLLGSHENFRRVSAYLLQEAQAGRPQAPLESLFRRWISAMRGHEAYEEHKLYPFLERRWDVSFKGAEAGHVELHKCYDAVIEAFARVRAAGDAAKKGERAMVIQALEAHDRVLREHLELEENLVVPLLLELSPEEFEFFCNSSIATLLRAYEKRAKN